MTERSLVTLRQILHAAARVLGCAGAQMALFDEEQQNLVLRVTVANQDVPRLLAVESVLGFSPDGLTIPLTVEQSLLVRAVREGQLIVTGRFSELSAGLLSEDLQRSVEGMIGVHTYAAVPVLGRSGVVGVLLFEKPGDTGFAPPDRDLLVAYADRVGAEIEAQAFTEDVAALESLGDLGAPPALWCAASIIVSGRGGCWWWTARGATGDGAKDRTANWPRCWRRGLRARRSWRRPVARWRRARR